MTACLQTASGSQHRLADPTIDPEHPAGTSITEQRRYARAWAGSGFEQRPSAAPTRCCAWSDAHLSVRQDRGCAGRASLSAETLSHGRETDHSAAPTSTWMRSKSSRSSSSTSALHTHARRQLHTRRSLMRKEAAWCEGPGPRVLSGQVVGRTAQSGM
eukprot:2483041-Rhodomonas_salina.2